MLTQVDFPNATPTNYFEYNGLSERTKKTDSRGETNYTWLGASPILETDQYGNSKEELYQGGSPFPEGLGLFQPVEDFRGSGAGSTSL